jgi:hypothetical protein
MSNPLTTEAIGGMIDDGSDDGAGVTVVLSDNDNFNDRLAERWVASQLSESLAGHVRWLIRQLRPFLNDHLLPELVHLIVGYAVSYIGTLSGSMVPEFTATCRHHGRVHLMPEHVWADIDHVDDDMFQRFAGALSTLPPPPPVWAIINTNAYPSRSATNALYHNARSWRYRVLHMATSGMLPVSFTVHRWVLDSRLVRGSTRWWQRFVQTKWADLAEFHDEVTAPLVRRHGQQPFLIILDIHSIKRITWTSWIPSASPSPSTFSLDTNSAASPPSAMTTADAISHPSLSLLDCSFLRS